MINNHVKMNWTDLAILSYCFLVSVFAAATNVCLTLHSRKFPASHRYLNFLTDLVFVGKGIFVSVDTFVNILIYRCQALSQKISVGIL